MSTSRQMAYEKALCLNKSHFGKIVTGRNFTETKLLETKLKLLEKDKLMVERDLFWKQRQFFIDKAFDKERRLKYKKLLNNITLKDEDNNITDQTSDNCRPSPGITCNDNNLTSQFFPGKIDTETSINYRRILQEKRKLQATVNVFRAALELNKKYREGKKSGKDDNLQVIESQTPGDEQNIDDVRRYSTKNLMEAKNKTFFKLVAKNWKNFKKPKSTPEPSDTSLPPKIQRQSAKRCSTITPAHLPDRRNSFVTTDSDKVLLRLAMTLPPQVLTEAGDKLSDLSALMGFSSRNKMLRQRELSILQRPVLVDNRFVNLQNSLSRPATNHY